MSRRQKLKREMRLRSPGDFKRAYRQGRAIRSPHFVLYTCDNGLAYSRIGFSFPRSKIKLATARNRIRRMVREFWRKESAERLKGLDIVLTLKKQPVAGTTGLKEEIKDLFNRVK